MTANNSGGAGGGLNLFGVLGVVFVVLKLTGTIDWSWWWVLAPFWGGFVFSVVLLMLVAAAMTKLK